MEAFLRSDTSVAAASPRPVDDSRQLTEQVAELAVRVNQLTSDVAMLSRRLEALAAFEEYRDVILSRHSSEPYRLPSCCRLDVRDFMDCADGIHELEYSPSGEPFRWTGPNDRTRFAFFVDRGVAIQIRIGIHSRGRLTSNDVISVAIDGISYPLMVTERGDELVSGPVEARVGKGSTQLILRVPVMFTPDPPSEDRRRLGIAITSITLEPFV